MSSPPEQNLGLDASYSNSNPSQSQYSRSWRPPTPPPEKRSKSNNKDIESSAATETSNASWFKSLVGFNKRQADYAAQVPTMNLDIAIPTICASHSGESMVDESLLLHEESINDLHLHASNNDGNSSNFSSKSPKPAKKRTSKSIKQSLVNKLLTSQGGTRADTHKNAVENTHHNGHNQSNVNSHSNYLMMASENGYPISPNNAISPSSSYSSTTNASFASLPSKRRRRTKAILKNADEKVHKKCSFFYTGIDELEAQNQFKSRSKWSTKQTPASVTMTNQHTSGYGEYFNPESRNQFIQDHNFLNDFEDANNDCEDRFVDDDDDENNHKDDDDDIDNDLDFATMFTFGCSPTSRAKEQHRRRKGAGASRTSTSFDEDNVPAIADLRKSSLSYFYKGRIQIRLPGDRVRLVMDEFLKPGILSVEKTVLPNNNKRRNKNHDSTKASTSKSTSAIGYHERDENNNPNLDIEQSVNQRSLMKSSDEYSSFKDSSKNSNDEDEISLLFDGEQLAFSNNNTNSADELRYVLTVDQDLYKRVLSEIADSKTPCGFYYCCHHDHESDRVHICVAIWILLILFTLLFWGTCEWPTD